MEKQAAEFGFLFILGLTVLSAVMCKILHHKLYKYLREKHTEKWIELTTIFGFGPGAVNSRRSMKFVFSKEYFDDPELLRIKVKVRNSVLYTVTGILAVIVMFFIVGYTYTK
jgi:hypothetical protein